MAPLNQAVGLLEAEGDFVVQDAPYTQPGPSDILVKNAAVAVNPMDFLIRAMGKNLPFQLPYPFIIGADMAGEVFEVGPEVTKFKKGDRVICMSIWFHTHDKKYSGFQKYSVVPANVAAALPDEIPFTEGVVLPLAVSTSAMGLYPSTRLGLPLPQASRPQPTEQVLLIWGAASSCGGTAVQLAVASGATVIATASSSNHEYVKSMGARTVLDYHSEHIEDELVQVIKATNGIFVGALDAIGREWTLRPCANVVKALGGGKVVTNLPTGLENPPAGVEVHGVTDTSNIGDYQEIVEGVWGRFVPEGLKTGALKPLPPPINFGKGLEKISHGVDLCQKGLSAGKAVVEL